MKWLQTFKLLLLDALFPIPELPPNIRLHDTLFCPRCRARLANNKMICHKDSQFLLAAATQYEDPIKSLIWHLKYRNRATLSEPLSKLAINYLDKLSLPIAHFITIPIPLSEARQRERGYNQAELIAKIIAGRYGLPIETSALIRQRHGKPQAEIKGWDERKKNIAGSFGILHPELIKDKNILLVDDVFTSGATIAEAAHQLKDFGAKKIIALVIAKAG